MNSPSKYLGILAVSFTIAASFLSAQEDSPIELYDLSADLGETKNLAEQYPEIAAEISNLMAKARSVHPDPNFNFPDRRYVPRNTLGSKK